MLKKMGKGWEKGNSVYATLTDKPQEQSGVERTRFALYAVCVETPVITNGSSVKTALS